MEEQIKNDFSWKRYLILVIMAEIITIFLTLMIWFNTRNKNDLSGIAVMPIWILNSFIIFAFSMVKFIKYKKYKSNGCNVIVNIIIAIFSSIMISIGTYGLNLNLIAFFEGYGSISLISNTLLYLLIGIILIFPVFKHKK